MATYVITFGNKIKFTGIIIPIHAKAIKLIIKIGNVFHCRRISSIFYSEFEITDLSINAWTTCVSSRIIATIKIINSDVTNGKPPVIRKINI